MAKKKQQTDDEQLAEMIAKESNPDHFEPQKELTEEERESRRPKVADPKHLKPQE